jgi:uncharacterized protein
MCSPQGVSTAAHGVQGRAVKALRLYHAHTFAQRLGGLLVRERLREREALVLAPCASVHTCFMRYSIDVVFVDKTGCVLKLVEQLAPWRAALCWRAHAVLELAAGQARAQGIELGMQVDWRRP